MIRIWRFITQASMRHDSANAISRFVLGRIPQFLSARNKTATVDFGQQQCGKY
jgi:hypothetical protein